MTQETEENSKYKTLVSTIREMQEYSRFRDTSALPRDPIIAGHKPDKKERYDAVIKRLSNDANPTPAGKKLLSILKKLSAGIPVGNKVHSIRTGKDINNKDNQRHISRNRKMQYFRKINE